MEFLRDYFLLQERRVKSSLRIRREVKDLNLAPDIYVQNLEDIDFGLLAKMGIHSYIVDWDQTACDKKGNLSRRNAYALRDAVEREVIQNIIVLTNSLPTDRKTKEETIMINMETMVGIPIRKVICLSLYDHKPKVTGFKMALDELGCDPREVGVIGDQLISDIKGAKRIGVLAILVDPVGAYGWKTVLSMRYFRNQWAKKKLGLRYTNMRQIRKELP